MLYDIIFLLLFFLLLLLIIISINCFSLSKDDAFKFPRAAHISSSVSGTTYNQYGRAERLGFKVKEALP